MARQVLPPLSHVPDSGRGKTQQKDAIAFAYGNSLIKSARRSKDKAEDESRVVVSETEDVESDGLHQRRQAQFSIIVQSISTELFCSDYLEFKHSVMATPPLGFFLAYLPVTDDFTLEIAQYP